MASNTSEDTGIVEGIDSLIENILDVGSYPLDRFSQLQNRREQRLKTIGNRLKTSLGKRDTRVLALVDAASRSILLKTRIDLAIDQQVWRPVKSGEWRVNGKVVDEQGLPISSTKVRVYDRDRKYDDLLGTTTTDMNGRFTIVYDEKTFQEHGENLPELYVMVEDGEGNELYSSKNAIRYQAGRKEYFDIKIPPKTT